MIPSDRRPDGDAPPPAAPANDEPRSTRGTLPPPEWTTPQGRYARATLAPPPLERRKGVRAEEAWRRARVEERRAAGEAMATREACAALARWLASRDRDLDEAVDLAMEALRGGDDVELRRELAAWLESLGGVEAAVDQASESLAARGLGEQLDRARELFDVQLQFHRELLLQLRAGARPSDGGAPRLHDADAAPEESVGDAPG